MISEIISPGPAPPGTAHTKTVSAWSLLLLEMGRKGAAPGYVAGQS